MEGGAFFPSQKNLHFAYVSHGTFLVGRKKKKNRELQMDLVSAKISTPKDSGRKNALKP